jgi:hypothetical protein
MIKISILDCEICVNETKPLIPLLHGAVVKVALNFWQLILVPGYDSLVFF